VLVDERDPGMQPRVLFYLEHAIQDAGLSRAGERRVVSKRMLYVEMDAMAAPAMCTTPLISTTARSLRANPPSTRSSTAPNASGSPRTRAERYRAMPSPMSCRNTWPKCAGRKLELIAKTEAAVKDRLTKEITYWDHRAEELKLQEQAGKPNAKLNSGEARKRADLLQGRLQKRLDDLKLEAQISPLAARGAGRPAGRADRPDQAMTGQATSPRPLSRRYPDQRRPRSRRRHGHRAPAWASIPTDREFEKLATTSKAAFPGTGKLRFIEVKGRVSGAPTITVTRNEILYSLNKPDDFILAIVEFIDEDHAQGALPAPAVSARAGFQRVTSVELRLRRIARACRGTALSPPACLIQANARCKVRM
jgi:hypothetical protein